MMGCCGVVLVLSGSDPEGAGAHGCEGDGGEKGLFFHRVRIWKVMIMMVVEKEDAAC